MLSTPLLASRLKEDYPQFTFLESDDFSWSPSTHTIFFNSTQDASLLLHELSHALLAHTRYARDIELLEIEQAAWAYATTQLKDTYDITISYKVIESHLDSYRDWLHARSTCPSCSATGIQVGKQEYKCLACGTHWHVNEARTCALRRYVQH